MKVTGTCVAIPGDDVDTDRIIPARYMKCVTFDGLGEFLFYDVRFDENGRPKPCSLNDPRFHGATILIGGRNFGCGSSREHAPAGDLPLRFSRDRGRKLCGNFLRKCDVR